MAEWFDSGTCMKELWLAAVFCATSGLAASAASLTVSDNAVDLPEVARTTTAVLLDAGLPAHSSGGGKFTVEARRVHCDQNSRGPFDASNPVAGLSTVKCRINSKNLKDTKAGTPFGEARVLNDLLIKIQQAGGGGSLQFNDCASGGYCGTYALSIKCTIDTKIEGFNGDGRWSCIYTDLNGPIEPK